jgi:hypothetical protein
VCPRVVYMDVNGLRLLAEWHEVKTSGSYSRQHQAGQGDDLQAFVLDWEAQQARCPQGQTSVHWRPGRDVSGDPVIRIRFDGPICRACPARPARTTAKGAPRQLTVRPQVECPGIMSTNTPPARCSHCKN